MSQTREAERPEADRKPATAIYIQDVHKSFRIPHHEYSTLKERALHPFRPRTFNELRAVRGVSVEIADGEFFGIIGRNGSGKSTLLKCIAGIYGVDRGRIAIAGRLSPFIELGVGFNVDLTARDNVIINAIMLGLSRREAAARFENVLAFSELEEFVDMKLKNYSSGMLVRLAFATAIQVDADILLIDEVLAVGDAAFQQKCFEQFFRLKREGKTIVFVSHDMHSVERFCDRALLLERGEMMMIGQPRDVARAYHKLNFGQLAHESGGAGDGAALREAELEHATRITDAWFEDGAGNRLAAVDREEPLKLCFEAHIAEDLDEPVLAVTLRNEVGHTIIVARSDEHGRSAGQMHAGETIVARFSIPNWLTPSRYSLSPSIAVRGTGANALALVEDMASIVIGGNASGGVLELPIEMELQRR